MKRRSAILVLAGATSLLVVGIGLWFATMPYPIADWWESYFNVRYSDKWPISESDFATAKRLVKPRLRWREIITGVAVTGPEAISISTTSGRNGEGRDFIIKKVDGKWVIVKTFYRLGAMIERI